MVKVKYSVPEEIEPQYKEALVLIDSAEYERAREIIEGLLERYPKEPQLLYSLGITHYHEDGDEEKVEEYFLSVIELEPAFSEALSAISTFYSSVGKFEESAEYARRAIRAKPENAAAWNTLGLHYIRIGRVEVGLDYFIAAYGFDQGSSVSAYNAACALTELGRYEEALKYLEKALVNKKRMLQAKNDPVLNSLRECPDYERIIAEAEGRLVE